MLECTYIGKYSQLILMLTLKNSPVFSHEDMKEYSNQYFAELSSTAWSHSPTKWDEVFRTNICSHILFVD